MPSLNLDFPTLLASSIHDLKNSVTMVIHKLEFLGDQFPQVKNSNEYSILNYEAQRTSHQLLQLLTVFKLDSDRYPLQINDINIYELLEDAIDSCANNFAQDNITIEIQCAEDLNWALDRYLISSVISNALNNAYRYTISKIVLAAAIEEKRLCIRVHDDGKGYPKSMLQSGNNPKLNENTQNTGLGLVFAHIIAHLHQRENLQGEVRLSNGGNLPGSCFTLYLP